jgi:outer membrane receptor for ferrienterochelin and colicins
MTALFAQPLDGHQTAGSIKGQLIDQHGNAVPDAYVLLNSGTYYSISDSDGYFSIQNVRPGTYELKVTRIGFQPLREVIELTAGDSVDLNLTMATSSYMGETVVVTATRSLRDAEEVPTPVTVISKREIQNSGSQRLGEILSEQIGMTLTSDHGTGIQVQGFDPEYTLIMIDGQPLIGRRAGTLDLDRISVGNVEQVEIVKGPSSALWGSDALGGVINIITESGQRDFEAGVTSRYGSNQNVDLSADLTFQADGLKNSFFVNRNSSQGYSLNPNSIAQTIPEFQNYTFSYRTSYDLTDRLTAKFRGRYYTESQENTGFLGSISNPELLDNRASLDDWSFTPELEFQPISGLRVNISHHESRYQTDNRFYFREGGELHSRDQFDQRLGRTEAQSVYAWNKAHATTVGGGLDRQQLFAERYEGNPLFTNAFFYGQHEWQPLEELNLVAGLRGDMHSEYGSRVTPKLSARYELNDRIHLRASAGSGFRAPDFRQLFLSFTNPTAGYSVFGSTVAVEQIQELEEQGQIRQLNISLSQINEIRAESSWAYNAGVDWMPRNSVRVRLNLFYNDVSDLIETAPIALKTNGQSVFSYFNLEEIFTRGAEASLSWTPLSRLNVSVGYQLLDARRKVDETRTVQDDQGEVVARDFVSFEPMFNRSKHSGTVKLFYEMPAWGLEANLRGEIHGPYGRFDLNGNGFVDGGEYRNAYSIWDLSFTKNFAGLTDLQVGIDNLLDFTRPTDFAWMPGRLFYAKASFTIN